MNEYPYSSPTDTFSLINVMADAGSALPFHLVVHILKCHRQVKPPVFGSHIGVRPQMPRDIRVIVEVGTGLPFLELAADRSVHLRTGDVGKIHLTLHPPGKRRAVPPPGGTAAR